MENIEIQRATISDLKEIQKLNNKLFELEINNYDDTLIKDWPLTEEGEKYFKNLIENEFVAIATIKDNIVGYLAGTINEQGNYEKIKYGELNNMYVDGMYRNYGIGKKLFNSFKEYCLDNEINNLIVTASAKNNNAINFYKKMGFDEFNITLTCNI